MQPKLLRALEKREVRRVGASTAKKVDVRVVAATNRDLAVEVNRGNFREDLYFRLAVVEVLLPPLRSRRADVPTLVRHFMDQFAPGAALISDEMMQALAARPWPGNVRELRNAVERASAMVSPEEAKFVATAPDTGTALELMQAYFQMPIKEASDKWSELFQRAYLEHVLRQARYSVSGAARLAGVNRRYVHRMMKKYDIRAADTDVE
jgi:DNA-binding NtrC family response regulator